jgi:hypothetical protein
MIHHRLPSIIVFLSAGACLLPGVARASTMSFEPGDPLEGLLILIAIVFFLAILAYLILMIDWAEQRTVNKMRENNDLDALVNALRSPWLGPKAALALGRMHEERALEPLVGSLRDRKVEIRLAAAKALGELGDGRAVEPLSRALDDEYAGVRDSARQAIGMIRGRSDKPS